jgi:serine protease AprX
VKATSTPKRAPRAALVTLAGTLLLAPLGGALVHDGPASAAAAEPPAALSASPAGKVTPALARLATDDASRAVDVIVQFNGRGDAAAGHAVIRAAGGEPGDVLELIGAVQARMPVSQAVRLAGHAGVRAVTLNGKVESTDAEEGDGEEDGDASYDVAALNFNHDLLKTAYPRSIAADSSWKSGEGETGKGVGVAVIDTGIAGDMVDFQRSRSDARSRLVANVVVHPDATNPGDQVGHGTHVAGLIAGNGTNYSSTDPRRNRYVGIAPHANLINVKASDDQGNTTVADVINGLQFVVEKKRDFNIRVVNLSLTSTVAQSYTIDPLAAAAEQAHFAGILVVAASGNNGPDSVQFAPGNDPYVLSVGGADDRGTKDPGDDTIASWTSTGYTQDGFRKPEVMAPGARLFSTLAPGAAYAGQCPECVQDTSYIRLGGTSMAAGVASGAAAIIAQVHPEWGPSEIKGALIRRSRNVPGTGTEIDVNGARTASGSDLVSNTGLTPSTLIDPATGMVDQTRARWGGFEWQQATDSLRARWGGASFVCSCAKTIDLASTDPLRARWGGADPARARWGSVDSSRARWGSVSWSTSFTR